MNERIRQLAEQSYEAATITTIDPFTQEVVVDYIDGTKPIFNIEKFAELLEKEFEAKYFSAGYIQGRSDGTIETVRDCVAQIKEVKELSLPYNADREQAYEFGYDDGMTVAINTIEERFGVLE